MSINSLRTRILFGMVSGSAVIAQYSVTDICYYLLLGSKTAADGSS